MSVTLFHERTSRPGPLLSAEVPADWAQATLPTTDNEAHKKMAPRGHAERHFMVAIVAVRRWAIGAEQTPMSGAWLWVLLSIVLMGLPGCAWLGAKQSELALRPTPGRPAGLADDAQLFRPGDLRFKLPLQVKDGVAPQELALWWLPHADPHAPVLLYLHGTFRNLYQNLSKIDALRQAGFAIVAVDYRGWGDSTRIVPDEASITADALLAFGELQRRQPDARRRVIFGHSMGGAVAVRLASTLHVATAPGNGDHGDYGALVLESTFTRLPDVAAAAGFWGRLAAFFTTLRFDSVSRIGQVDAPILMLHGTADATVPVMLGRNLRDAALQAGRTSVRWVEIPGGTHSQLHTQAPAVYAGAFQDLIAQLPAPQAHAELTP
jgi:pimeloyl-ACP methyl ester carboxylesterase